MGTISNETLAFMEIVREDYPKTWEWIRYKANWEHMCVGAVFNYYREYIEDLMQEEKNNV